jgi:DNA (cytosine-5)-methyltransferase 1
MLKFYNSYQEWLNKLTAFGYVNYSMLLNAKDYGIPQNRERVFCVSIRKDVDNYFWIPNKQKLNKNLYDFLEKEVNIKYSLSRKAFIRFKNKSFFKPQINPLITGTINTKNNSGQLSMDHGTTLVQIGYIGSNSKGNRVYNTNMATCLTGNAGGRGAKTGLYSIDDRIRRLTPCECFKLMGFKDEQFDEIEGISDSQLYKMAGNSIVVNVLEAIFKNLFKDK